MPPASAPPITLFGATGYTGQLVARALARAGLDFRIAGRSPEKLASLSAALPNHPQWLVADAAQAASLPPLFQDNRLLINCAGPFTDLGERIMGQAALNGVHYLDTTNELGYVFRARTYSDLAKRSGAALVPACGFEVALADCAAHLVGAQLPGPGNPEAVPLDEVSLVYILDWTGASRGTRRSAVRSLATSWIAFRDGGWTGQIPGTQVRRFSLPLAPGGAAGPVQRYAIAFPSCESITVPAHLSVSRVDAWMGTSPGARFWGPVLVPLLSRLSRGFLRGPILWFAALGAASPRKAEQADPQANRQADRQANRQQASGFSILASARLGHEKRSLAVAGRDPYGLTAEIIVYAARQILAPGYDCSGMLAPSQAFDPRAFLDYAQAHWGVTLLESA